MLGNTVVTGAMWIPALMAGEHIPAYVIVIRGNGLAALDDLDRILGRVLPVRLDLIAGILPAKLGTLVFPALAIIDVDLPGVARCA